MTTTTLTARDFAKRWLSERLTERGTNVSPKTFISYLSILTPLFAKYPSPTTVSVEELKCVAKNLVTSKITDGHSTNYINNMKRTINTYWLGPLEAGKIEIARGRRTERVPNVYVKLALQHSDINRIMSVCAERFLTVATIKSAAMIALLFLMISTCRRKRDLLNLDDEELRRLIAGEMLYVLNTKSRQYQRYKIQKRYRTLNEDNPLQRDFFPIVREAIVKLLDNQIRNKPERPLDVVRENYFSDKIRTIVETLPQHNVISPGVRDNTVNSLFGVGIHDVRRWAITNTYEILKRKEQDEAVVHRILQTFAGHSSWNITQRYIRSSRVVRGFDSL